MIVGKKRSKQSGLSSGSRKFRKRTTKSARAKGTRPSSGAQKRPAKIAGVTSSSLIDQLAEYNVSAYNISHGRRIGTTTIDSPLGASITDSAIQQTLQQLIASSNVPQPTSDTLYFFYLPPVSGRDGRLGLLPSILRLPQPHFWSDFLRGHAISRLSWLSRILATFRRTNFHKFSRAVRGHN